MANIPSAAPSIFLDANRAKQELILVVDRMLYILNWIAENPTGLVDGRHQKALKDAVDELDRMLTPTATDGTVDDWKLGIEAVSESKLKAAGLTGSAGALKFGVFNQHFEQVLDFQARRGSKERELEARELEEFRKSVHPWYRKVGDHANVAHALGAGSAILGSIISVVAPNVKERLEGIKELGEMCKVIIEAAHTER